MYLGCSCLRATALNMTGLKHSFVRGSSRKGWDSLLRSATLRAFVVLALIVPGLRAFEVEVLYPRKWLDSMNQFHL